MSQLKYVMLDNVFPIIFGDYFTHRDVFERTRRLAHDAGGMGEVTGAGFLHITEDGCFVYGRSESLDKDPSPTDKDTITKVVRGFL